MEKRPERATPPAAVPPSMQFEKEDGLSPFRLLSGWGALMSAALLLALLPAGRVAAQPIFEGERTPKEPPQFHFTPSLSVAELYNDNILLRSFLRESDLITRVRPGLIVSVDQARVKWLTDLNAEAEFYRKHTDLSTFNRSQTLDTHLTIRPDPRWTFDMGETFVHSNDPVARLTVGTFETPLPGGGGLPSGGTPPAGGGTSPPVNTVGELVLQRTEYYTNLLSLKGAYRLTQRLTGEVEGINRIINFKDPRFIDSSSNEVRGALPFILTPVDVVTPEYRYRNFLFEHRAYTEVHTASLRMQHRFTSTLTGRAAGGLILIVDRGTVLPDFLAELGVEQTYSETITFRADYTRDVSVVGGLFGTFASNIFSGSMTAHASKTFDTIVAGSWALQQGLVANRNDLDTLRLYLEEQVKLTNWLKVFLSYEFMNQNYHSDTPDIYNNRIFFGVTVSDTYPSRP
ncbi:MAG TPA: hypothetical protein VFA47_04015 [Candidatus Manganitrophaceae bacterium]|nr:hypothetical protein [Candidatus Manganitrophaceae bacterium]